MATLTQYMTFENSTLPGLKGWAQVLGNAFSTFGWASSEAGSANWSGNYGTATITNIAITSNVLTVTFSGPTNQIAIGMTIQLTGLTTNTFLNNQNVIVITRTNTTFTAGFTHADVVSVGDTGTMTAIYGWATMQNPLDTNLRTDSSFPLSHTFRFRGHYVAVTPTFTNLQRTNNQVIISFGTNGHGLDLVRAVGQGLIITSVVNASFNVTSGVTTININSAGGLPANSAGWPIVSLTSTTITINTSAVPGNDIASTPVSAGTGNPVYLGGATNGSIMDTVIYSGDYYIAFVATNFNNVQPGSNTTDWRRWMYEVWSSTDALSSTNKLYIKFAYGSSGANNWFTPLLYVYYGSGTDGIGNITQNYNWGTTTPYQINIMTAVASFTGTGTAQWESNFSGSTSRFQAFLWRGYTAGGGNGTPCSVISFERSHDNSGNDTDAYWSVFIGGMRPDNANFSGAPGGLQLSQVIFKPGTGGAGVLDLSPQNVSTNYGSIHTILMNTNQSFNSSIPVLPVFPVPGFVGNPALGVIAMRSGDAAEGALITVSLYGTTHAYLMSSRGGCGFFGAGAIDNTHQTAAMAAGIRWE
jgi:hypothetical protein